MANSERSNHIILELRFCSLDGASKNDADLFEMAQKSLLRIGLLLASGAILTHSNLVALSPQNQLLAVIFEPNRPTPCAASPTSAPIPRRRTDDPMAASSADQAGFSV